MWNGWSTRSYGVCVTLCYRKYFIINRLNRLLLQFWYRIVLASAIAHQNLKLNAPCKHHSHSYSHHFTINSTVVIIFSFLLLLFIYYGFPLLESSILLSIFRLSYTALLCCAYATIYFHSMCHMNEIGLVIHIS